MRIQSMTGFGKGFSYSFRVEIRSTNHKSLDIQTNIPPYLYPYECEIRRLVKRRFHRGRIEVYAAGEDRNSRRVKLNKSLAKEYYYALVSLKDELSIPGDVGINVLASMRDVFLLEEPKIKVTGFYDALEDALGDLEKVRINEGKNLIADIKKRIKLLRKYLAFIEDRRTVFITNARKGLYERLNELLGDTPIDDLRIIQESAILIERSDITEEIVRTKSHLKEIEKLFKFDNAVGKKIDFLVQELRREINTIGSKVSDVKISTYVVEMKHELEKIREQVQNLQ